MNHSIGFYKSPKISAHLLERHAEQICRTALSDDSFAEALKLSISMCDLTTLEGSDTKSRIQSLCNKAVMIHPKAKELELPHVAAVCVYPIMVGAAKSFLAGTNVKVASVATGFPAGMTPFKVRIADVKHALDNGADEIDMVINRSAFLSGDFSQVADEIYAVKQLCVKKHLKVILETGELGGYDNVRLASDIAIQSGADFIKTSTGKVSSSANLPVVLVMLQTIADAYSKTGKRVGMKPAGGIRTAEDAVRYLQLADKTLGSAWLSPELFRFGASGLLDSLIDGVLKIAHR